MNTIALLAHQKLVAGNNGGQTITDLSSTYQGQAKFMLSAKSDAGTNPTLAVKLQNSAPLARLADVTPLSTDTTAAIGHRTAADTAIKLAASFVLAAGASISKIYLPLKKTGAPTGTLTAAIYADTAGDPSGSALATFSTLDVSTLTTSFAEILFSLTSVVDLAAGTYHIVVTSTVAESATVLVLWNSVTVASGGNGNVFGTGWAADDTINFAFKAFFYTFADVTGGGFTGVTTTASLQTLEINVDKLSNVRAHITVGGTNTPAFYAGVIGLVTPLQP